MTQKIPFKLLSKNGMGFHLIIKILVNGKVAKMIIDTGASHTVFDKTKMKKYVKQKRFTKIANSTTGVGATKMDSHHTIIEKIKIGKMQIQGYPGVMLDLSHVNASYVMMGLPEIDGVLGADIFVMFSAVIDYKNMTLTLNDELVKKVTKIMGSARLSEKSAPKKKIKPKKKK